MPAQTPQPTSSATTLNANLRVPINACDSHLHIYNDIFPKRPMAEEPPRPWGVREYKALQKQLSLKRAVVVTPSLYGTDNRATLLAIEELGKSDTRGIAVVHPDVTDAELQALHRGGIRGIRFTQYSPARAATTSDMIEPLAQRVQHLGWHVQLHLMPDQIVEHRAMIKRLPVTLVFDHMVRLGAETPITHAAFDIVADLIARGRSWVKLSGAYLNSDTADHSDTITLAQALIRLAPQRMVWGSDWPHPTEHDDEPDEQALLNLLAQWAPDEALQQHILVENPAQLYEF